MEKGTDLIARERGKHYMEDDVECERNCGRNNNNKTAIERRAAELAGGCKRKREREQYKEN